MMLDRGAITHQGSRLRGDDCATYRSETGR